MKDEVKEWVEELEKMKEVNFFPYLITNPFKGDGVDKVDSSRKDCSGDSHCGRC